MWSDDFHHAAHVLLTGERAGYYADYGKVGDLAQAFRSAMVNPGQFSTFRQRRHGRAAGDLRPQQAVRDVATIAGHRPYRLATPLPLDGAGEG